MKTTITTEQAIEAINNLKQNTDNNLILDVIEDCLNYPDRGYDNPMQCIEDVLHSGCISGVVNKLIAYVDTQAYYIKFASEIDEMIDDDREVLENIQTPITNWLAWFGYEQTIYVIQSEIEQYIDNLPLAVLAS